MLSDTPGGSLDVYLYQQHPSTNAGGHAASASAVVLPSYIHPPSFQLGKLAACLLSASYILKQSHGAAGSRDAALNPAILSVAAVAPVAEGHVLIAEVYLHVHAAQLVL